MVKPRQQNAVPPQLQLAIQHHQAGRLDQAAALYKKFPGNADAVNLLGLISYQQGKHESAVDLIKKAIRLQASNASFHYNLGLVYQALNQPDDALACYKKAVALKRDYVDALLNLGVLFKDLGQPDEAVACYEKIVSFNPAHVDAYNNLGAAYKELGRLDEAIASCQKALALDPQCINAHNNMGTALEEQGKLAEAEISYRNALAIQSDLAILHCNLGRVLKNQKKLDESIPHFVRALELNPAFPQAFNDYGIALQEQGKLGEAVNCFHRALHYMPDFAEASSNLGTILQRQGKLDEAIAAYRQAISNRPDFSHAWSNLLYCHNYHPTLPAEQIFSVYQEWNAQRAAQYSLDPASFSNQCDPQRRLKIGYVSADFNHHSALNFIAPLIEHCDKNKFEIFCYYNHFTYDTSTERIVRAADHWVPCMAMPDDALAQRIRDDGIDILIDLSGHTEGNRLMVFARKPAPVQASWLGFGYTTGLSAMDYFIGDPIFTPLGCEHLFSESIYRLQRAAWAYAPPVDGSEPGASPAQRNGYTTFACLSRSDRINARMIAAWSAILLRLPTAHLRLDSRNFGDAGLRADMAAQFAQHGVPATQLEMGFTSPFWSIYQEVDIVLDCFPHNSGTTTFEALWMGIPVITLADRPSVGRLGASIVSAVDHAEWIATDSDDYIERAVALGSDLSSLQQLRSQLRPALEKSPLMDQADFVHAMEDAYRNMWQNWCATVAAVTKTGSETTFRDPGKSNEFIAPESDEIRTLIETGRAQERNGKLPEAEASYRAAVAIQPNSAAAHFELGRVLRIQGKSEQATVHLLRTLEIAPDFSSASNELGIALQEDGKMEAAIPHFERVLQLLPNSCAAYSNLGITLQRQGKLDEAIAAYRRALQIKPDLATTHSNLLYCHNYHPDLSAEQIFEVYRQWNTQQAAQYSIDLPPYTNQRDPERRLKVGYVSADFNNHSVLNFFAPLIEQHDKSRFEVFCYYNRLLYDEGTVRIVRAADHWVPCSAMSDDELAQRIRNDGIDILVDLSGHTEGNRLMVFARKPAPVQASCFGFGYTTGLATMDYFIGDPVFTPIGCDHLFSETIVRLPHCFAVYLPPSAAPAPNDSPAVRNAYVTFACLSRTDRINHRMIEAWAAILRRLPKARLRLDSKNFSDENHRRKTAEKFFALGVPATQLQLGFTSPVWQVYQEIDIVLDCFPHNSGTTTFEALWMGIPVITLADRPSVGRLGASLLACLGRHEWIATDSDDYIERAVALAGDVNKLAAIRASLRQAMQDSPLLDQVSYVHGMEAAYRDMWHKWCATAPTDREDAFQTALAHHQAGRLQQAEEIYITMHDRPDAMHLLGVIASQCGQHELAIERIQHAIQSNPGNAAYHCNLGSAYQALQRLQPAVDSYRQALALSPGYPLALNNLGNALKDLGQFDDAVESFRQALALKPDYFEALSNLGAALNQLGRLDEAIDCFKQAIAFRPNFAEAHFNCGNAYTAQAKLQQAVASFQAAIAINPDFFMAHNNLGLALIYLGRLDEAIVCFQRALAIKPDFVNANSNLLFCHNYHPTLSAEQIFAAYQRWNLQQAAVFSNDVPVFQNVRDVHRRLRVGYVSADFHNHSVIHFAGPVIEHQDKTQFEVFCYANHAHQDSFTERLMAASDHWIPCASMSDDALAQRIRDDGIDILIDLSGHTLGHRLLVFARKPAPVQASWLGFGYTTGLTAMDYFIGDPIFTPPGCEHLFSESLMRLPHCFAAYQPPEAAPLPGGSPAQRNGFVTFGCLSRNERINAGVIETWAALLHRLPSARLRIDSRIFREPDLCEETLAKFNALDVPAAQLQIGFTSPVWDVYQEVDIVLDCFPHNSGTTTYEALWMGVPVITLADRPSVGRIGASVLTCIGKPEWVAHDRADYVERAVALAENTEALAATRATLRQTMLESPLLQHTAFAQDMQSIYREMWARWCKL